jgi:glyoxylase-like metal-dependent hydrolase (beta-lactamase superfamily II)
MRAFRSVADGVLVRTSRRMSTTTTLVVGQRDERRSSALLVDPAWEPDELVAVADELEILGVRVVAGFATHAHHDHLLWHPRFGDDVARWATASSARTAHERRSDLLAELTTEVAYPREVIDAFARVTALDPGAGIPDPHGLLPDTELVVHDGHAPGHGALWLPGPGVLVVGDMLSDVELPLPFDPMSDGSDLGTYLDGLDRLTPYLARASILVPGHGSPTRSPLRRLDADRRYLDAVLAGRAVDDPRLADPAMAAEHERTVQLASGG